LDKPNVGSLRALDALNFCNAGIQTGLGPFMSIFYTAVRHWNPGQIGVLIACQSLTGILFQSAVGKLVDESRHKQLWTAAAAVVVASGAVGIVLVPRYSLQIAIQLLIGLGVTVFPAATAAFALGLSERSELSNRVARNEVFTHTGNVIFAVTAGAVGTLLALQGIFFAAAVFAAGMAPSALLIRKKEVNYEAARGGNAEGKGDAHKARATLRDLASDRRVLLFMVLVVLFYAANAATLPLVGEILSKNKSGRSSAWQVSAMVIVAETVMVLVAMASGTLADKWGRKPLFLIGFAVLAARNLLTVASHNTYYLIGLQSLDGVAMALFGVLLTLVTADLAEGTGRFNFLQGTVQSAMGMGGFLSNLLFGFIAKTFGFNSSFIGLAAVAFCGGALYALRMPETRRELVAETATS
jgi:MFS family permease